MLRVGGLRIMFGGLGFSVWAFGLRGALQWLCKFLVCSSLQVSGS